MVFLEAKTLGVTIVSADFGSAHEFVGEHGFVLSVGGFPKLFEDLIQTRLKMVGFMDHCQEERLIDDKMRNKLCKLFTDL